MTYTWTSLTSTDLDAENILTETTMNALRDNPIAIAERAANAPRVQPAVSQYITTTGSGTWTIPDGVTAWEEILIGGSGPVAGSGSPGKTDGGDTTTTYDSVTVTAGGSPVAIGGVGAGGTATGGDLNINGSAGYGDASNEKGGDTPLGYGQGQDSFKGLPATGYGSGVSDNISGGRGSGSGAVSIKRRTKVAGLNTVSYDVGAGGSKGSLSGVNGRAGILIFRY